MDMQRWIELSLERDDHLVNAQMALYALDQLNYPPESVGIIRRHLARVWMRETNLAEFCLIIMDGQNSPSNWKE